MSTEFWKAKQRKDGSWYWESFDIYKFDEDLSDEISKQAGIFGRSYLSVTDDKELTTPEKKFLSDVTDYVQKLRDFYLTGISAINKRLTKLKDRDTAEDGLKNIITKFRRDCDEKFNDYDKKQRSLYKKLFECEWDLNFFRKENKLLNRIASYPESMAVHLYLIYLALTIEALANAFIFQSISDRGYVGGVLIAGAISTINVLMSVLAGYFGLRYLFHVNKLFKFLGALFVAVCFISLSMLHLLTAHYRELIERDANAQVIETLSRFTSHPFEIYAFESFLLILIGYIVTFLGFYKGYSLDDRYPGYGKRYRTFRFFENEINDHEIEYKSKINDLRRVAEEQIYKVNKNFNIMKSSLNDFEAEILAFYACCQIYFNSASSVAEKIIITFRKSLHEISGDASKFPITGGLQFSAGGMERLDPEEEKEKILSAVKLIRTSIDVEVENFSEMRRHYENELQEFYDKYTSAKTLNLPKDNRSQGSSSIENSEVFDSDELPV